MREAEGREGMRDGGRDEGWREGMSDGGCRRRIQLTIFISCLSHLFIATTIGTSEEN